MSRYFTGAVLGFLGAIAALWLMAFVGIMQIGPFAGSRGQALILPFLIFGPIIGAMLMSEDREVRIGAAVPAGLLLLASFVVWVKEYAYWAPFERATEAEKLQSSAQQAARTAYGPRIIAAIAGPVSRSCRGVWVEAHGTAGYTWFWYRSSGKIGDSLTEAQLDAYLESVLGSAAQVTALKGHAPQTDVDVEYTETGVARQGTLWFTDACNIRKIRFSGAGGERLDLTIPPSAPRQDRVE